MLKAYDQILSANISERNQSVVVTKNKDHKINPLEFTHEL